MHLQIAAQLLKPVALRGEKTYCLRTGEKIPTNSGYWFRAVRLFNPLLNLFFDKWTDAAQLSQRPALRDEVRYFLRPQKRAARGSTKRAHTNARLGFCLLSKQLRNIRVRQHTVDSFPDKTSVAWTIGRVSASATCLRARFEFNVDGRNDGGTS